MKRLLPLFAVFFMLCGCSVELPGEVSSDTAPQSGQASCTVTIECKTVLDNMDMLDPDKKDIIPPDGIILPECEAAIEEGDTVFDLLADITRKKGIHMEFNSTPAYDSKYIEGIANLYAFDCGELSGWMFSVNGEFPTVGANAVKLNDGDKVRVLYSCELGQDIGNIYGEE